MHGKKSNSDITEESAELMVIAAWKLFSVYGKAIPEDLLQKIIYWRKRCFPTCDFFTNMIKHYLEELF